MATVKVTLKTSKKYTDGTHPVILKIRANGRVAEVQLCRVPAKQWIEEKGRVRATYPHSGELNEIIQEKKNAAEKLILSLEKAGKFINPDVVVNAQSASNQSFTDYLNTFVAGRAERGNIHTAEKYQSHVTILTEFVKGKPLHFDEVTDEWINKFIAWERKRGISPNTIHRRVAFLKTVWNDARKRGFITHDPFAFVEVKEVKTKKVRLTADEIAAIETLDLPKHQNIHKARCAFLLQYYLRGARISDVLMLKPENIVSGRIEYISIKTGAIQSVGIHPKLRTLLESLLEFNAPYLLPIMTWLYDKKKNEEENERKMWAQIESRTAEVNYQLKKIAELIGTTKKITTHIARHTFARMVDAVEPDKRKVSAMLGHSSFGMTEKYLESLRDEDLDDSAAVAFT
ncbi:MAG: site-specific integrase [Siphonobacter sp.]